MRPERRNTIKVLLFLDIGGSMDGHIKMVEAFVEAVVEVEELQVLELGLGRREQLLDHLDELGTRNIKVALRHT